MTENLYDNREALAELLNDLIGFSNDKVKEATSTLQEMKKADPERLSFSLLDHIIIPEDNNISKPKLSTFI